MALDSRAKRASIMGFSLYSNVSVHPDASKGAAWRQSVGFCYAGITLGSGAAPSDVFFENRNPIEHGMKPNTAAGMGGVMVE